jgi:glutathione S-transferase
MYTLYVIPTHPGRSAMLMLEHKQVRYRRVELVTLLHPLSVRLRGFDAGGETRTASGRRTLGIRLGDLLGTVPALAADGRRISTNHQIARFLEDRHPEPALFPADPDRRRAVEEAERWGNDTFQMAARRILTAAAVRDPAAFSRIAADGRIGYLLYRNELLRRLTIPPIASAFAVNKGSDRKLLAELPPMLDRIDAWIGDGILGQQQLNVADFMIAPSLALILYRPDIIPLFEGRPSLTLVDRLLPEPDSAPVKPQPVAQTS